MSTVVNFQGKNCIEPGSYAATVYNPTSVANVANFGNAMIIDTGLSLSNGVEFSGGSGIKGTNAKGLKAIYEFTAWEDFSAFVNGGPVADIAKKLFMPIEGSVGIPKLYYTRAATTVPASLVLSMGTKGDITFTCKNEGIVGNGVLDAETSSILKTGYAAKIITGSTPFLFILQVYKGTWSGVDKDGEVYGTKSYDNSAPILLAESPECTSINELKAWAISNKVMTANFLVSANQLLLGDLATRPLEVFTGGATTSVDNEYKAVLEAISELDVTFFLCDKYGVMGADTATNGLLHAFLKNEAKFTQFMVIGGGEKDDDLFGEVGTSEAIAKYYNDEQVVTVHGSPEDVRKDKNGNKSLPSIYLAASVIGLNASLAPQTPLTFKRIGYKNFVYDLKKQERVNALQAGIMHVRNVNGYWCINQGITTIQDNLKTIADDGESLELSIALIKAQLNKELIIDAAARFTGDTVAQASPESLKNFTETKLASRVARPGNDNLIITWKNVKVTAVNGDFFITYDFVPNVPNNKMFFIGNMLDFTV